jgi:cytochrome c
MLRPGALVVLVLLTAGPAAAADIAAGAKIFQKCKLCHTTEAGGRTTLGPNLHDMFGRRAGSAPGYNYSEAMKNSGIVWTDEALSHYLRDPKDAMPGNRMAFPGIKDDREMADLLAYLKDATK